MSEDIFIHEKDAQDFFYKRLVERGYVPIEEEVEDIIDITFDYLVSIGILSDIEFEEGD